MRQPNPISKQSLTQDAKLISWHSLRYGFHIMQHILLTAFTKIFLRPVRRLRERIALHGLLRGVLQNRPLSRSLNRYTMSATTLSSLYYSYPQRMTWQLRNSKTFETRFLLTTLWQMLMDYALTLKNQVQNNLIFIAKGVRVSLSLAVLGSQIRGIRKGPKRPTKVILDDLEHSERVYSPLQREKLESYFKEDVGKVGDEKTNIELVGTVLHRDSLLANLLKNPAYNSKKYQSIIKWPDRMDLWNEWESIAMNIGNDDRMEKADEFYMERKADMDQGAEVMWPEKEPLLHLFKEKLEIGRRAFFKEKQNEPLGSDERVFERILWYKEEAEGIRIKETDEFIPWTHLKHSCYGALDPASGQTKPSSRKKSDFACLLTGYKDPKGRLIVHKDWTRRKPPSAQIKAIFDHHDSLDYQKFGVETNLYRELLLKDIIEERRRIEKSRKGKLLKIPFYDILNTENKDKRIHRLEPKVSHGWILFNENLSAEFQNQLIDYPYIEHDDCLDALEMLWMLLNNAYKAAPVSMSAMGGL
jgi:hypothetical protein